MLDALYDIAKKSGIVLLVYGALVWLGNTINDVLEIDGFLTGIFSAVKAAIGPFDYFLAVDTFVSDMGLALSLVIAFWTTRASIGVYKILSK